MTSAEKNRRYRARHGERIRAREKEQREAKRAAMSPEEMSEYRHKREVGMARFRAANPDYWRQWQGEHRDEVNARHDVWRRANPDKAKAATDRWRDQNREKVRESVRRRKARQKGASGAYSLDQLEARREYYGRLCWICRVAVGTQPDHVVALCNGGTNWAANIRPACGRCNSQKGRWEQGWAPSVAEILLWAKLKVRDFPS